jgi:hypothetical protein
MFWLVTSCKVVLSSEGKGKHSKAKCLWLCTDLLGGETPLLVTLNQRVQGSSSCAPTNIIYK